MKKKISPSMMCASPLTLANTLKTFESNKIEYLHIDIMDGEFVPNYTLGPDYCRCVRNACDIPLDIHLMITSPDEKLERFDIKENDLVSVHFEASNDISKCLDYINSKGAGAILAINPKTPCDSVIPYLDKIKGVLVMTVNPGYAGQKLVEGSLEKIKEMRHLLDGAGYENVFIEVDGNVSFENGVLMKKAGADMFVAGSSSVFTKQMTLSEAYSRFKDYVK